MSGLTNLTPKQLQTATKNEIAADIKSKIDGLAKRELIQLVLGTTIIADTPICIYRKEDGQAESQVEIVRDAETGAQVSCKVTTWEYFKSGEIQFVRIRNYDAKNIETDGLEIEHFLDRQPVARKLAAGKAKEEL